MPFLEHFGLQDYPFGLTPNPKLYYPAPETEAVIAALVFAIMRGDGLLKVTGEIGTGKTLICRMLLDRLAKQPVCVAYLNAPVALAPEQIPAAVAREFGLKLKAKDDPAVALRDFLLAAHTDGKHCLLIIDEAQALGEKGLEAVRLLSNLETETDKLLQIVLFGQQELDVLLHRRSLRQIMQRINFGFTTKPMPRAMVADYLHFRLQRSALKPKARGKKKKPKALPMFTPGAVRLLVRASGGLPRMIHVLADKALLAAYAQGVLLVDTPHVRAAVRETKEISWFRRLVDLF